jgi:hypothetical protein
MKSPSVKLVRCAIYTRVSTEHGLDQEFNSLDAQYDAASAYIKSQAHAGWAQLSLLQTKKSLMPRDPFVREKFTRERNAAKKLAAEYFQRFPKNRYQTEVESWRRLKTPGRR